MGIVSFGRSATVSTFVTSLALIVLSFTLSEQCIQPVFDRTNSSGMKMENCFQNFSTVIFVEGSIHGQQVKTIPRLGHKVCLAVASRACTQ